MSNHYNSNASFVAPAHIQKHTQASGLSSLVPQIVDVDASMTVREGAAERTSGLDRAIALVIRLAPFSATWLVLAVGVSWAASMGGAFALCLFAGLTSVTYAYLDHKDHEYSRNGLERHRVNTYASLKRDEMVHQQELRRMALQAHLRMLGVQDDK